MSRFDIAGTGFHSSMLAPQCRRLNRGVLRQRPRIQAAANKAEGYVQIT